MTRHLYKPVPRPKKGKGSRSPLTVQARCEQPLRDDDKLVEAALHSDCDECRVSVGVARVGDQAYGGGKVGIREPPVYKRQPMIGSKGRERP